MDKRLALVILTILAIALSLVSCGPRPYTNPTPIPTLAPATMPVVVPTQPAAGEETLPTPVDGAQVFETSCAICHNLTAETKVGPGLAGLFGRAQLPNGQSVTEENLKEWIVTGGGAMPAVPLTEDQLAAVVDFLKDATAQ